MWTMVSFSIRELPPTCLINKFKSTTDFTPYSCPRSLSFLQPTMSSLGQPSEVPFSLRDLYPGQMVPLIPSVFIWDQDTFDALTSDPDLLSEDDPSRFNEHILNHPQFSGGPGYTPLLIPNSKTSGYQLVRRPQSKVRLGNHGVHIR